MLLNRRCLGTRVLWLEKSGETTHHSNSEGSTATTPSSCEPCSWVAVCNGVWWPRVAMWITPEEKLSQGELLWQHMRDSPVDFPAPYRCMIFLPAIPTSSLVVGVVSLQVGTAGMPLCPLWSQEIWCMMKDPPSCEKLRGLSHWIWSAGEFGPGDTIP